MTELSHLWRAYARLQAELDEVRSVGDRSWGIEAALDSLLVEVDQGPTEDELQRIAMTSGRRERARARLRHVYLGSPDAEDAAPFLEARLELRAVHASVSGEDWALLRAVGEGRAYPELAEDLGTSAGALRIRVLRLRRLVRPQDNAAPAEVEAIAA